MIKNIIKTIFTIVIIGFIVTIVSAGNERTVNVVKVIDGDTIIVNNENGSEERIRFVGINTPELGTNGSNESKLYVENKILGKQIYLDVDDKKPKDIYNRTLAVILIAGDNREEENLNKELLCKNYAQVMYIPPSEFNPYVWQSECTGGHITYRTFVDQDYGFYKVVDITTLQPAPYENNTLNIKIGDTVIWENRADPDWPLTIISEEGLWGNRTAYLRWNYQKFSYTFNKSGTYNFYIEETRRKDQKIVVAPKETPIGTVTPIYTTPLETPIETPLETPIETPPYSPIVTKTSGFTIIIGIFGILTTIIVFKLKNRSKK